jgi:hypothetical protein
MYFKFSANSPANLPANLPVGRSLRRPTVGRISYVNSLTESHGRAVPVYRFASER